MRAPNIATMAAYSTRSIVTQHVAARHFNVRRIKFQWPARPEAIAQRGSDRSAEKERSPQKSRTDSKCHSQDNDEHDAHVLIPGGTTNLSSPVVTGPACT